MPRRSAKRTGIEFIMVIVGIIIVGLIALWNFLVETKLIWFVPFIIAGILLLRWYLKRKSEEKRAEEIRVEELRASEEKRLNEEKRVEAILSHNSDWSSEMCSWLIENNINLSDARIERIMAQYRSLGAETCQNLIHRRISIGMKSDLVNLSLGEPTIIDNAEISAQGEKFRWVYGVPRRGAIYIWFKDGLVTKIKQ